MGLDPGFAGRTPGDVLLFTIGATTYLAKKSTIILSVGALCLTMIFYETVLGLMVLPIVALEVRPTFDIYELSEKLLLIF